RHIKSEELRKLFWATQHEVHFVHLIREDQLGEVHRYHGKALKEQYPGGENVLPHVDPAQILTGALLAQYQKLFEKEAALTVDDKARLWGFSQRLAIHVMRTLDAGSH